MSPRRKARLTYRVVLDGEVVALTRERGTCGGCEKPEVLLDDTGSCRACRERAAHRCARCGVDAPLVKGTPRHCHRCVLKDELAELFARGVDSTPGIVRLHEALLAAANSQGVRRWLGGTSGGVLLAEMLRSGRVLTHDDLDAFGADRSVTHLRGVLVAAGVLADEDRSVLRFEERARATLTTGGLDPSDLRVARSWLAWSVLAGLHRRQESGRPITHSTGNALTDVRQVARFLANLHERGGRLGTLAQSEIDAWFAGDGALPFRARPFLSWAVRHGHVPAGLTLPPAARTACPQVAEEEARWTLARAVVNGDDLSADVRVAAALVLLYGQPLARIARLRRSNVYRSTDDRTVLELDGHPLPIHEPFATLIDELPVRRQNGVRDQFDSVWLFPRSDPARHVVPKTLGARLRRIGIEPRPMRNAARAQLAAEIPAALLCQILGVGPDTAVNWAKRSAGSWTGYAAVRASTSADS